MVLMLKHLRDFCDKETLNWMVGNIQAHNCMLLKQNKKDKDGVQRTVVQVFDSKGIYIGEISRPEYIPNHDDTRA